jgi:hypothetical protein
MQQRNFLRQFSLFAKLRLSLHFRFAGIFRLFWSQELLQRKYSENQTEWQIFALPVSRGSQDDIGASSSTWREIQREKPLGGFDCIRRVCSTVLHWLR